jgi:hypothetical protein
VTTIEEDLPFHGLTSEKTLSSESPHFQDCCQSISVDYILVAVTSLLGILIQLDYPWLGLLLQSPNVVVVVLVALQLQPGL